MTQMNPPVKDLRESLRPDCLRISYLSFPDTVPRMTPILRNRHEKVQEATINLIGRIGEFHLTQCCRILADPECFPPRFSRPRCRVRPGEGMDAYLFRVARFAEGA